MIEKNGKRAGPRILAVGLAVAVLGAVLAQTPHPVMAGGSTAARLSVRGIDGRGWFMPGTDTLSPVFSGTWTSLGGGVIGAPAVVSVPIGSGGSGAGTPYYIATGLNHNLFVRSESLGWQALSPAPVYCVDGPGATSVSAHSGGQVLLIVGCRGTDGALWYAMGTVTSDPNVLPSLTGWTSLAGGIIDAPAIAAVPPFTSVNSEITFFVNGFDGHVWTRTLVTGWVQTLWGCVGHLAAASVIGATSNVAAFACQGLDEGAWVATNAGSGWTIFSAGGLLIDGPGIALGPNSLTVVGEGRDNQLWQRTSAVINPTSAASFGAWSGAGGYLTNGATAAALLFAGANP
jgi:hypothetical protein